MLLLRVVAPADMAPAVLGYLDGLEVACDVIHLPGAGRKPAGDLIQCVVPPESASAVAGVLRQMGVPARGSMTLDRLDAAESVASAIADRTGADSNAVVWEEVETRATTTAELSVTFLVYMMAATVIAASGILTDSLILIVGAMVVGPEFGPLAGLCVGVVRGRRELVAQSVVTLSVGFALAIGAAFLATWAFKAGGVAPGALDAATHPETVFISRPDAYAVVIAALAGVAGMLSLTTASTGTLIGILISVTTIPAAANIGVGAAYGNDAEIRGAATQLGINVAVLLVAGLVTLKIQQLAFARQLAGFVARLGPSRVRRGIRPR